MKTKNNYCIHHCLYHGPKIWNSLPVQITSLSSFPNFKKKTAGVLSKIISEMAKPHTAAILMQLYCSVRVGLNYKPGTNECCAA